jgi:hypothetical protein
MSKGGEGRVVEDATALHPTGPRHLRTIVDPAGYAAVRGITCLRMSLSYQKLPRSAYASGGQKTLSN